MPFFYSDLIFTMNSTFLIICYHSSFPKKRGKKGKLLPTQERRSEIIGFPKVQTSSFLSQLSVKKCMCELGDFYIFHELLVAGGEKREFYFCYVITLQFSGRHSTSMDNSYEKIPDFLFSHCGKDKTTRKTSTHF